MEKAAAQDPPVDDTQMDTTSSAAAAAAAASSQPIDNTTNDDEGAINESSNMNNDDGLGSGIRPIFLGNLSHEALSSDIELLFRNPVSGGNNRNTYGKEKEEEGMASDIAPFHLDRVVSCFIILCTCVVCVFDCTNSKCVANNKPSYTHLSLSFHLIYLYTGYETWICLRLPPRSEIHRGKKSS